MIFLTISSRSVRLSHLHDIRISTHNTQQPCTRPCAKAWNLRRNNRAACKSPAHIHPRTRRSYPTISSPANTLAVHHVAPSIEACTCAMHVIDAGHDCRRSNGLSIMHLPSPPRCHARPPPDPSSSCTSCVNAVLCQCAVSVTHRRLDDRVQSTITCLEEV